MSLGKTFLKSASLLLSGTVVAQAMTFFFSFVLARIYAPEDFGRYTIFVGFAGVLAAAATGTFDRVILLASSLDEARRVATLTLTCSAIVASVIALVGGFMAGMGMQSALPLPLVDVILFLPVFIFLYGAAQVFIYSSLRTGAIRALAGFKVVQSAAMGVVQLAAASLANVSGLILGNVIGWLLLAVAGLRWRLGHHHLGEDLRISDLAATARAHRQYPRYIMPNEVLDNLSNQVPILLVGSLLSLSFAGHYGLAIMMLSAPAALAGQAVGQSFLQFLGTPQIAGSAVRRAMFQIWGALAALGLLPFAAILFFGPQIAIFALGPDWLEAGRVAQALSILLFVRFVSSPTSTVYLKLGLQKQQWRFCVCAAIYRTATYALLGFAVPLPIVIMIHVAIECVAIVAYNYTAIRHLQSAGSA
jgi:O-antigen/teichoic acid export membrane protein